MKNILTVDKRTRFLIHSLVAGLVMYYLLGFFDYSLLKLIIVCSAFTIVNIFGAHYPNIGIKNIHMAALLPFSLVLGGVLFLKSFPNFTSTFQVISIMSLCVLYYVILLSDNIFLVVSDKEDIIPLYRVAITWSQILSSVVSIPLFVGIFKIPVNSVYQSIAVGIISFFLGIYQVWSLKFDSDSKKVRVGEELLLSVLVLFLVSSFSVALSFFPAEAFLRALVTSAVLMYGLSYVNAHIKNNITKKYLLQNSLIVFLFIILTFLFHN